MDLNIKYKTTAHERELTTLVKRVAELGWQGMAWNQNILSKANAKNTSKPRPPITLSTIDIQSILKTRILIDRTCQSSEEHVGFVGIRQLHRVTLTIDDVMDIQALNATNDLLRAFDIVAVTPGNYKVFAQCCKQADIDVISIDFSHRVPFAINKKLVDVAVQRGICLEIKYSPCIQANSTRKETFSGTKHLIKVLRGRNLILSSGAENINHLRGPHDVINIALMMKLNPQYAHDTIKKNCEQVIQHGIARKNRFLPIEIINNSSAGSITLPTFQAGRKRNRNNVNNDTNNTDLYTECYPNKRKVHADDKESDEEENDEEEEEDGDDDNAVISKLGKTAKPSIAEEEEDVDVDDGFLKL